MSDKTVKVAVATSDGIHCDLHFGAAKNVTVYVLEDGSGNFRIEGQRAFPDTSGYEGCGSGCHARNEEFLQEVCQILRDCQYLLVVKIGPFPSRILLRSGIEVLEQEGEVRELLSVLYDYINRNRDK